MWHESSVIIISASHLGYLRWLVYFDTPINTVSDFLDIITRGLDVATSTMGETFTLSGTDYKGVFSNTDTEVDYEGLSGYDTEQECKLSVSKTQLATVIANDSKITRADNTVWVVVESSTSDDTNFDYRLKLEE